MEGEQNSFVFSAIIGLGVAILLFLMFFFGTMFGWGFLTLAAVGGIGMIFLKIKGG